jgi:hypothetical protein
LKNLVFHLDDAGDEANYTLQKTCAALLERGGRELRQFNLFFIGKRVGTDIHPAERAPRA